MNIEVVSKIEVRVGENSIILSRVDARKLIKQLQEAVGEDSPQFTGVLTYPSGVHPPTTPIKRSPWDNIRGDHGGIPDVNMERYGHQSVPGTEVAFDRGV